MDSCGPSTNGSTILSVPLVVSILGAMLAAGLSWLSDAAHELSAASTAAAAVAADPAMGSHEERTKSRRAHA